MRILLLSFGASLLVMALTARGAPMGGERNTALQRAGVQAVSIVRHPAARPARGAARHGSWISKLGALAIGGLIGGVSGENGFGNTLSGVLSLALIAYAVFTLYGLSRRRKDAAESGSDALRELVAFGTTPTVSATSEVPVAVRSPDDLDAADPLGAARLAFAKLVLATELGMVEVLRELATPEMYAELAGAPGAWFSGERSQLASLRAELLERQDQPQGHARVRFSGMRHQDEGQTPMAFQEIWHLVRLHGAAGPWLLARIDAMS